MYSYFCFECRQQNSSSLIISLAFSCIIWPRTETLSRFPNSFIKNIYITLSSSSGQSCCSLMSPKYCESTLLRIKAKAPDSMTDLGAINIFLNPRRAASRVAQVSKWLLARPGLLTYILIILLNFIIMSNTSAS